MKTFKQLLEEIEATYVGNKTDFMSPSDCRYMRDYLAKISGAFQPSVERVLETIDVHLAKFGYTLDITPEEIHAQNLGDEGEMMLAIHAFSTKEHIKNCYITMKWSKLASGQQFFFRSEALNYSVKVILHETTPQIFDTMLSTYNKAEDGNGYVSLPDGETGHSYR